MPAFLGSWPFPFHLQNQQHSILEFLRDSASVVSLVPSASVITLSSLTLLLPPSYKDLVITLAHPYNPG